MKVTPKILDDVLEALFLGDATDQTGLAKHLNLRLPEIMGALLILKNDGHIEYAVPEGTDFVMHAWVLPTAMKFINEGGYSEIERVKKLNEKQINSVVLTNRISIINAFATLLFGLIETAVTIITCKREANREHRELIQSKRDSLNQLQQARHESQYEIRLRRIEDVYQKNIKDSASIKF